MLRTMLIGALGCNLAWGIYWPAKDKAIGRAGNQHGPDAAEGARDVEADRRRALSRAVPSLDFQTPFPIVRCEVDFTIPHSVNTIEDAQISLPPCSC